MLKKEARLTITKDLASVDIDDKYTCCVRKKSQPGELEYVKQLVLVTWQHCTAYEQFTYLKFCSKEKFFRRHSAFYCFLRNKSNLHLI